MCLSLVPCGSWRSERPCLCLQRAEDDVWGCGGGEAWSKKNKGACRNSANRQISLALESESAGEEDSNAGNRSLQSVLVNVPGTDFHSLERANASRVRVWPWSKGYFSAARLLMLCFPAGELAPLIPFCLVYPCVWCPWIRVELCVLFAE